MPSSLSASSGPCSLAPRRRPAANPKVAALLCAALSMLPVAGCSTQGGSNGGSLQPTSVQKLEYYPYQVKGYQDTYPHRTILVLVPVEARASDPSKAAAVALRDKPAIGVATDTAEAVVQLLYSEPLAPIIQNAIARSAEEAGLRPVTAATSQYNPAGAKSTDYVLASKITRCWVEKHRASESRFGPIWHTTAEFALSVRIYKRPFRVPFWEGSGTSTYYDPPAGSPGLGPEDAVGIYDEPGQVLSVALTRAVAAIFEHLDLRTLILEDHITPH